MTAQATAPITLPKRRRGRQNEAAQAQYEADLESFCAAILEINSRLDFRVSSRGWCYLLEEHGLDKGDFDTGQRLINDCRKSGLLPLDICSEDAARQFGGVEQIDLDDPDNEAQGIVNYCRDVYLTYTPFSFWHDKDAGFSNQVQHLRFSRKASAGVLKPRHFLGVEFTAQVISLMSRAV